MWQWLKQFFQTTKKTQKKPIKRRILKRRSFYVHAPRKFLVYKMRQHQHKPPTTQTKLLTMKMY